MKPERKFSNDHYRKNPYSYGQAGGYVGGGAIPEITGGGI
jgi:hypothetical protein